MSFGISPWGLDAFGANEDTATDPTGAAYGTSTVLAIGLSIAIGVGTATGSSDVSAGEQRTGTGTASGTSTVNATGGSVATALGESFGVSTATCYGSIIYLSTGTITASSTVYGRVDPIGYQDTHGRWVGSNRKVRWV